MDEGDTVDTDKANFEQVQALIRDQVREHFNEFSAQQQQRQVSQGDQQAQARQQLRDLIDPIYGHEFASTRLDAADAKDEASFYRRNADAVEMEEAIEKQFNELKKNGRPTTRQDIYDWMNGREQRTDPEKWSEKQNAKHKAQLEKAEAAADVGMYGAKIKQDDYVKFTDFGSKTLEEQEQALDGMTF